MREITPEELKHVQIAILDHVTEFCDANNIHYWLDSGTLLGAVRHKGYIPWDDDIDIGMLRDDYERFYAEFNKKNTRYQAYCIENQPDFPQPAGKVFDTNTILYEPDRNGIKLCINIDIFVFDNVPNDKKILKKMYRRRDCLRVMAAQQRLYSRPDGNAMRRLGIYTFRSMLRLFPQNYFLRKMAKNAVRYRNTETTGVGNFVGYVVMYCEKDVFDSFIDIEFEGKQYKAPVGYDKWLRNLYGDYMQLPPEEQRVSHHSFEAYIEE